MSEMHGEGGARFSAGILRGKPSWDYFYVALGFVLTIESTIVTMITRLECPWNILLYLALAALTLWAFSTRQVREVLLWFKRKYESIPD
jgi:hypothetical protein